ncbi:MAG: glycosyltransferase [Bacteroidota bacterium]
MEYMLSFIIPVYNRPDEIGDLLNSMVEQKSQEPFEVVIIEDGSTLDASRVVQWYRDLLDISYFQKPNSGPGDSRNYGMKHAKGNYFIILDSDCILPPQYLETVKRELDTDFVHCFGGPDNAHESFSKVQKAINYAMTSFFTTGGIRGGKKAVDRFQPRSFNMGISKTAFEKVGGFGQIHPGEDPDLTFRIWNAGFTTRLFPKAFVYHKRRIDWNKFWIQVNKFGMVRPILNKWHPKTKRLTYWFPTFFMLGLLTAIVLAVFGYHLPLLGYGLYFSLLFFHSLIRNQDIFVAIMSLWAVLIQFAGYGYGFLKSTILVNFSAKEPQTIFPKLFFKRP